MPPSSASPRDPLDNGSAPWTQQYTERLVPSDPTITRPLPHHDRITPAPERVTATAAWDTINPAVPTEPEVTAPSAESVQNRQKEEFGGIRAIPGLFGWLSALSVSGLLLWAAGLLNPQWGLDISSIGAALDQGLMAPQNVTAWAALAVLGAVEFLAYLAGGYVGGRMARFSGAAQGVSVWLWSLLGRVAATGIALLGVGVAAVVPTTLTAQWALGSIVGWGLVALAGAVLLDLVAAVIGGLWGTRYHHKVDTWSMRASATR